jgi:hypothetical protein
VVISRDIRRLLHEGDWACAYGDPARLRIACAELARAAPHASMLFERVARSADRDLELGRRLWIAAATELRHPSRSSVANR